jgi:signal peptidase I
MQKPTKKCVIKFSLVTLTYILTVIWIGNYWLLFGIPIIFDVYISKIVPWSFWKKPKNGKKVPAWIEWVDALIFALVAVYIINIFLFQNYKIPTSSLEKTMLVGDHLFVSKVSFGPRMPITPLAFPLVQNTFPWINAKSFSNWPTWDYKRLKGFSDVMREDIVVFNFPTGDTVPFYVTNPDYYITIRERGEFILQSNPNLLNNKEFQTEFEQRQFVNSVGRKYVHDNPHEYGDVLYRPVDRRDNYVKRCVAVAGDTLEIIKNQIFINGVASPNHENIQHNYRILTDGTKLNQRFYEKLGVAKADQYFDGYEYVLPLNEKMLNEIKSYSFIKNIRVDYDFRSVFPYSIYHPWTRDNYGPIWIPKAGVTIDLNLENILLYERIITSYERNSLAVKDSMIFINDQPTDKYTFKMNYYFMMGDNRHKSADSRYWGFVPEDHIVGRPILVWLSLDADKKFPANIRWKRFFKMVNKD